MPPKRWATALLAILLLGSAVTAIATPFARPAAATATGRPNIVLILTDDQTMEAVAKMPYVSSRPDWITFDNAFVENSLCCPSRATILSGQYDTKTQVQNNATAIMFDESQTLPVWLSAAGYRTGMFGKYFNDYPYNRGPYTPPGWSDWQAAYGKNAYLQYDYALDANGVKQTYGHTPADYQVNVLAQKTEDFIATSAAAKVPFFAYYAPTSTHTPWIASPARTGAFSNSPVTHVPSYNEADVSDKPSWIQALPLRTTDAMDGQRRREWAGALSIDDTVKQIDQSLEAAGVLDNTVEIFMTDNGYSFGEHRWVTKRCVYNECGHVPLMIRYPVQAARHQDQLISNADITSTITAIAGAAPGRPQDGASLVPLLTGRPAAWRTDLLLHWPGGDDQGQAGLATSSAGFWAVQTATAKYVELDDGEKELYNESTDPYELQNLANMPRHAAQQKRLAAELAGLKSSAGARADSPPSTTPVVTYPDATPEGD